MSQATGQILLTIVFLGAAIVFVAFREDEIAIALVGAVIGQGAGVAVQTATNGNGGKK